MNRPELNGLFGVYEIEMAVERMLQIAESSGKPFESLEVSPDRFKSSETNGSELSGFCELLAAGWMTRHPYYHRYFCVSSKLVERMRQRPCWRDMCDPPTDEQRIDELTAFMKGSKQ